MAGNARFELTSGVAGNLPPITEYVDLEPVKIENQKYTRVGELRSALGIKSFGSIAEDNSFGAAHSKPVPAVATEELRRFKATVLNASDKAKCRKKMFDESLHKVNKYYDVLSLKKQRSDVITNARSAGMNVMKLGNQSSRNPAELVNQKVDDRPKNGVLNKRVRSSVAEIRAEGQSNGLGKRTVNIGRDRETLRDCGEGSDITDEKIRRLPVGGETWDRKMKRKRSVGPLMGRASDDGEPKRAMHHKLNNDLGSKSSDAQVFRSGLLNGSSKFDGPSQLACSNGRATSKNELEKVAYSRDSTSGLIKERFKGNNKINSHEDNKTAGPNIVIKGKASRGPRTGPVIAGSPSPNFPRSSQSLEAYEQPANNLNKIHSVNGVTNRARPIPAGSSSPPMAQWVGQRPQKMARTRRANVVPPVPNHDEPHKSPESFSPSDFGSRFSVSGTQQFRVKIEKVSSPAKLSEGEESAAYETRDSRLMEKGLSSGEIEGNDINVSPNTTPLHKKVKMSVKEDFGDSVKRQGRSGRGSLVSRVNTLPMKEKSENGSLGKQIKSARLGSEKSGSKTGRPPLKKMLERKSVARLGHVNAFGSPDLSAEQGDDHEELLEAAKFAYVQKNQSRGNSFWKKFDKVFSPITSEDLSFCREQLKIMEINVESSSNMVSFLGAISSNHAREENFVSGGIDKCLKDQAGDFDAQGRRPDSEGRKPVIPLYQRVLSALIMEDEIEEFEEESGTRAMSFYGSRENSFDAGFGRSPQNLQHLLDGFSYNGYTENGHDGPLSICTNAIGIYSSDCPYEQLCMEEKLLLELQSVGIYPEILPNLTDEEEEAITHEILELQNEHSQKVSEATEKLNTIIKLAEENKEERCLEQIALDKLVELSYIKLLATRGSYASKHGLVKVPKPVAMAFMKRTLARCRRFEETGKSCFSEPALRDIIYATIPPGNPESTNCESPLTNKPSSGTKNLQQDLRISGPIPNWAERRDNQGDITGRISPNGFGNLSHSSEKEFTKTGPIPNRGKKKELLLDDLPLKITPGFGNNLSAGGVKGKRSERDREKDISSRNGKPGHLASQKGDRKTKPKPKPKTNSGNVSTKRETVPVSNGNNLGDEMTDLEEPLDFSNLPLPELDSIEGNGLDDDWLNMDFGTQDLDTVGLEIPMDDLSGLNMLM